MPSNFEKVKEVIDRFCGKHLNSEGGLKSCRKESCSECHYNDQFANEIIDALK